MTETKKSLSTGVRASSLSSVKRGEASRDSPRALSQEEANLLFNKKQDPQKTDNDFFSASNPLAPQKDIIPVAKKQPKVFKF